MAADSRFPTRILLSAAAIGAAGAAYITALSYASVFTGAVAYYVYTASISLWALPILIAQALLRRPGLALLTSALMGLISAPFIGGSLLHILNFVIAGVLFELPFLVTRYRRWDARTFWIAHPLSALAYTAVYAASVVAAFGAPVWWIWIAIVVGAVASALAVTGLAQLIANRLRAAGLGGRVVEPAPEGEAA